MVGRRERLSGSPQGEAGLPGAAPLVTVIISTYNRPDTLAHSVRSVMHQTDTRWALLVVGDGCDARTDAALAPWADDKRVSYVNLSLRCGEQALPNSAALALVCTPYAALLNHDDLWLPDHLETALSALDASDADLYLGRAMMCRSAEGVSSMSRGGPADAGAKALRVSPAARQLSDAFALPFEWFEPASAWVMRADAARRVGPWRTSPELYRVPLQEWLLRAWRCGLTLAPATRVTCLKIDDHHDVPQGAQRYAVAGAVHGRLMDAIESVSAARAPGSVNWLQAVNLSASPKWRFHHTLIARRGKSARWAEALLRHRALAALYARLGWDAHALLSRLVGVHKGQWMQRQLQGRTGEARMTPPPLQAVIEQLQAGLASDARWRGHIRDPRREGPP